MPASVASLVLVSVLVVIAQDLTGESVEEHEQLARKGPLDAQVHVPSSAVASGGADRHPLVAIALREIEGALHRLLARDQRRRRTDWHGHQASGQQGRRQEEGRDQERGLHANGPIMTFILYRPRRRKERGRPGSRRPVGREGGASPGRRRSPRLSRPWSVPRARVRSRPPPGWPASAGPA